MRIYLYSAVYVLGFLLEVLEVRGLGMRGLAF
jgi:hypothetical protein